jgi:hypothetical protein
MWKDQKRIQICKTLLLGKTKSLLCIALYALFFRRKRRNCWSAANENIQKFGIEREKVPKLLVFPFKQSLGEIGPGIQESNDPSS